MADHGAHRARAGPGAQTAGIHRGGGRARPAQTPHRSAPRGPQCARSRDGVHDAHHSRGDAAGGLSQLSRPRRAAADELLGTAYQRGRRADGGGALAADLPGRGIRGHAVLAEFPRRRPARRARRPGIEGLKRVALLEVDDLRTSFHTRNGVVRAVDGVSFCIDRGETLGIVGESGSGKSVTCLSPLGLVPQPPGRIEGVGAVLEGIDLLRCPQEVLRGIRGRRVAMIFQDPMTSLNPYMTIEEQIMEPLLIHEKIGRAAAARMALQALQEVGVPEAEQRIRSYPHQFSGGMRQRVMIAMALIGKPDLLIADEPTTALDVTVQAQILDLIAQQQRQRGVAVIFISHDLSVVAGFCDRVMVMYAGRVVETADTRAVFREPKHPYTRALQRARPAMQAKGAELYVIPGLPPDLSRPVPGCAFAPRCEFAIADCGRTEMRLQDVGAGQASACLRVQRGELTLQ